MRTVVMSWRTIGLLLGLCPAAAIAADPPFAPKPVEIDYVAEFTVHLSAHRSERRTVTHHGRWSHIEQATDGGHRQILYARDDKLVTVAIVRGDSGQLRSLDIAADPPLGPGWDRHPFKTDAHDTLLGERCDVWNVSHHTQAGYQNRPITLTVLSCVTGDGIELWRKHVGERSTTTYLLATSLVRQPVDARKAYPPNGLLDWTLWTRAASVDRTRAAPDAVVTLSSEKSGQGPVATRTMRRHFPWVRIDDVMRDGGLHLSVTNTLSGLALTFHQKANGQFAMLKIDKPKKLTAQHSKPAIGLPAGFLKERETGRTESILGEMCRWADLLPGMADAGHMQCRTADGLVLKDVQSGRGFTHVLVATEFQRTPVARANVLPPPRVLTPANWGLPEGAK